LNLKKSFIEKKSNYKLAERNDQMNNNYLHYQKKNIGNNNPQKNLLNTLLKNKSLPDLNFILMHSV
jgi:hypothetical protein